jgi:predicted transcriptional regulator
MARASSSLTVNLPEEIKHHLEALAATTGRSTDHLVLEALEHYLAEEARFVEEINIGLDELDAGLGVSQEEVLASVRQITRRARQQPLP